MVFSRVGTLHPGTRLLLWLLLLITVQGLDGAHLAAAFFLLFFFGSSALQRGWQLVRRSRWLLLSMAVIFSWGVAGEPLWIGPFAPTYEGICESATHLGRLLLVLMTVAALLESLPTAELLMALHWLCGPLRRWGVANERALVRLMLVLRYVESLPQRQDWRAILAQPSEFACQVVEIEDRPFGRLDYLLVIVTLVGLALLIFL